MNHDVQLQVQALLDGELPAKDRAGVEEHLARDPEAQALLAELKMVHGALAGHEAEVRVPETREFYWSQIQRRMEAAQAGAGRVSARVGWFEAWRRVLIPFGTAAAVLVVGLLVGLQYGFFERGGAASDLESYVTDPGAFTYRDYATRTTLVWLTFPAEK